MSEAMQLQKGLKQRHLTMIAIGGVIGAGLFGGSGVVMNETGPGAFLSYLITGVLIILVMRMLGEMATANPWLRHGVVADAREQYDVPVQHVVVHAPVAQ